MFNAIILPMWAMATGAFGKNKDLRLGAGVAFVCFVLSLAGGVFTAYLSQPIYADMLPAAGHIVAWLVSSSVAFAMFILCSNLAEFIASKLDGRGSAVPIRRIGVYAIIFVALGGFDATLNYFGSPIRSEQAYEVTTFAAHISEKALPFTREIENIDKTIEANKVMYKGKWTVRWDAKEEVRQLQHQRAEYVRMQQDAVKGEKANHASDRSKKLGRQSFATLSFRFMSVSIYLLMLVISIPIASYVDDWDMQDGVRDRKVSSPDDPDSEAIDPEEIEDNPPIGFAVAKSKDGPQADLSRGSNTGEHPQEKVTNSSVQSTHHKQVIVTGETDNVHPRFSANVQPDRYRGLSKSKYNRCVKAAKKVLAEDGRYNKIRIANLSGINRKTVAKYLRVAIENKDLEA
ncbi:MAG: hypothetical protein AAFY71_07905 [Bacteroidota bacterium]